MGVNNTILNIDLVLTKARLLAEKLQYVETANLSTEELAIEWDGIRHLSNQLRRYIPDFKEPSCDKCYNHKLCTKTRVPSLKCFDILSEV
jgi:hypothetical protein